MDADIAELVRAERLHEAATLARARGERRLASELFERTCAWTEAAEDALSAGDPDRALILAVQGGNLALAERSLTFVQEDKARCTRLASHLDRRGAPAWSARLFEAGGQPKEAARAWEQAGEPVKAAALLERAEDVLGAARLLETQLRRAPNDDRTRLALGSMLVRFSKTEAAVRVLQKVAPTAPERISALALLVPALASLGLAQAEIEAQHELEALGGSIAPASTRGPSSVRPEPLAQRHLSARLFGRYEVIREIASSPMARVVECNDPVRGELVAVKIFAGGEARGGGRDALARFEREVKVLGALEHPNVVPLRDYVADGPALVLAWMGGGTLETRLSAEPFSPARAVEIAIALLSALGEAHRLGVLHRDVKPANVLFDDAGVARLADFGVAHLGDLTVTATAGMFGTLAYMSPEQRKGRPATVQSDLYGVGAILLEMLTAERVDLGGEPTRLLPSATHRDLDTRHDAVLLRLLAEEPLARPEDAFAARRELTQIPWPDTIEPAAHPVRARALSDRPQATRLEVHENNGGFDRWIERDVQRVELSERTLARARAYALAGHASLQTVLRVDRDRNELWLETRPGVTPAREGSLTPQQAQSLGEALDALHAQGAVHGAVDPEHVRVDAAGGVILLFRHERADQDPSATLTVDHDRRALSQLVHGSPT